jgi:hypothetical protein
MEAPAAIVDRIRQMLDFYEALGYQDYESFASETIDDDGVRRFDSVWVFTEIGTMEAVLNQNDGDQLDGARLKDRLVRWAIKSRNYNFAEATAESRLAVQLWYTNDIWGDLYATGSNCDRLLRLLRQHVFPDTGATHTADPESLQPGT